MTPLPTPAGVLSASSLLQNHIIRTPLLSSPLLNTSSSSSSSTLLQSLNISKLYLKAECLQHTHSFKYRGALHRLLHLTPDEKRRGVVAFSSGNFGQALSAAAWKLGIQCRIVSPRDAPVVKLERMKGYGAELVLSTTREGENREVVASALARDISVTSGMTLLHPFEDVEVVHGQGTVGLEILDQMMMSSSSEEREQLDAIVVPCGGGGLTAGINLAMETSDGDRKPHVIAVEPKGYDDHFHSFHSPEKTRLSLNDIYSSSTTPVPEDRSIMCDALMAGAPGAITWSINKSRLFDVISSRGDASVANAMKVAFDYFRLVLEPSGALALAAVLDGDVKLERDGAVVVVVASGGNTDLKTFARMMGCRGMD